MTKETKSIQLPISILISIVIVIFSIGGWAAVLQYKVNDLETKLKTTERGYIIINQNLTKIHANIVTIANAQDIRIPFDKLSE